MEFLAFSIYKIMSSVSNDSFTSSFPVLDIFIYFFLLNFSGIDIQYCAE